MFALGMIANKLVGVEMMAVLQISFLSLLTLDELNPSFKALSSSWLVNGFNLFSLSRKHLLDAFTPVPVKGVGLYSRFLENFNLTLLLIFIPYLLSLVCFILSRTVYRHKEDKRQFALVIARKSASEYAFAGLMFSGYIIAVSFSL